MLLFSTYSDPPDNKHANGELFDRCAGQNISDSCGSIATCTSDSFIEVLYLLHLGRSYALEDELGDAVSLANCVNQAHVII